MTGKWIPFPYVVLAVLLVASFATRADCADETKEAKIKRAMEAGPAEITKKAKIAEFDNKGNLIVLREGSNGWTCFPGHPGMIGDNPECDDEAAMQWLEDFAANKPKPTNTQPGISYMFLGGSDRSASDPHATTGSFKEPPHWMILWPYDPKATGLSDRVKMTGTWIMWAGTPWAHLMINQKP